MASKKSKTNKAELSIPSSEQIIAAVEELRNSYKDRADIIGVTA